MHKYIFKACLVNNIYFTIFTTIIVCMQLLITFQFELQDNEHQTNFYIQHI